MTMYIKISDFLKDKFLGIPGCIKWDQIAVEEVNFIVEVTNM